jgi:hypothetical protein
MKREYEGYFALRYRHLMGPYFARWSRGPDFYYFIYEDLLDRIPSSWRADARFFLASNMLEMVIAPYDAVQGRSSGRIEDESVRSMIHQDLQSIVERSEEVSKRRDRRYVSSTSVAVALGELAESLKTNSLQIWGPDDSE